jgi:hypothetical protein
MIATLQNESNWTGKQPTICIKNDGSPEWKEAYENWLEGKNPTNSPEWKRGVYATF